MLGEDVGGTSSRAGSTRPLFNLTWALFEAYVGCVIESLRQNRVQVKLTSGRV